jgi:hypothetical protein
MQNILSLPGFHPQKGKYIGGELRVPFPQGLSTPRGNHLGLRELQERFPVGTLYRVLVVSTTLVGDLRTADILGVINPEVETSWANGILGTIDRGVSVATFSTVAVAATNEVVSYVGDNAFEVRLEGKNTLRLTFKLN